MPPDHGDAASKDAEEHFARTVQAGEIPDDIPSCVIDEESVWLPRLLKDQGMVQSTSEAKRLVKQGAVSVDGAPVSSEELTLTSGCEVVLKAGKRRYLKVRRS